VSTGASGAKEVEKVDINAILKSNEWKKDNCSAVVCKKDVVDDYFSAKPKQNKGKKAVVPLVEQKLNHNMEVLKCFDEMKIASPTTINNLDATIKLLEEKKTYFETLPKGAKNANS